MFILISFGLFFYSVFAQIYRALKPLNMKYKKTPEYKAFEKELYDIINNHKIKKPQD